jgi:antitoxin VapB
MRIPMALNIRNTETERLAAELAAMTGETKSEAVRRAVEDRLRRLRHDQVGRPLAEELDEIAVRCAGLPVLDDREPGEILGYDDAGVPS